VILPQAVRIAIAPTVGFPGAGHQGHGAGVGDRLRRAHQGRQMITNATFRPFLVYGLRGPGYFALCYPVGLRRYASGPGKKTPHETP
jgi:polar amino acid transport system permease protein